MKKILNYREKADKEFWDARKSNERNLVDIMKRKRKNMEDKRELTDINYQGKKEKHGESEEMFTQEDDDSIWSREVAVDISEMYAVDFLCRTDSTVKAGVELLIYALRSGGLSVTMDLFGAKVKLSQDHQKVFDIVSERSLSTIHTNSRSGMERYLPERFDMESVGLWLCGSQLGSLQRQEG